MMIYEHFSQRAAEYTTNETVVIWPDIYAEKRNQSFWDAPEMWLKNIVNTSTVYEEKNWSWSILLSCTKVN